MLLLLLVILSLILCFSTNPKELHFSEIPEFEKQYKNILEKENLNNIDYDLNMVNKSNEWTYKNII